MTKITLTADDGSQVEFVDPAGVQAAVDAALAAKNEVIADIVVENTDGSHETFVPQA